MNADQIIFLQNILFLPLAIFSIPYAIYCLYYEGFYWREWRTAKEYPFSFAIYLLIFFLIGLFALSKMVIILFIRGL